MSCPSATAASFATAHRPGRTIGRSPAQSISPSRRPVAAYASASPIFKSIGTSNARVDLPGKIFGESAFIHDMQLDGMVHARVVRQPNRGATIGSIDENAIRRAAKGPIEFVRNGNFLAIIGADETAVEAAGVAAVNHVTWRNVEAPTPTQQEANWLLQRPVVERVFGAPDAGNPQSKERYEATYTRGYLAHASISPSCGLAIYRDCKADGMDPLSGRLSACGPHWRKR